MGAPTQHDGVLQTTVPSLKCSLSELCVAREEPKWLLPAAGSHPNKHSFISLEQVQASGPEMPEQPGQETLDHALYV